MGARWLLAVAAYSGLAWAGIVYGACNQELLQKLLDRGFSNDEILQMCGRPLEVPNTPSRPPDRPPTELRESQERKKGARVIIRFEEDIENYIKEHQKNDPSGIMKFKKRYIDKQINCISMPRNVLENFSEELKNESCNEVHSSKKMRFYQCIKGDSIDRVILIFENDEYCRRSTEEIKELAGTAYDIHK
jgi:hypothetical protein